MRNAGGYAVITSPEPARIKLGFRCEVIAAGITERDTFTCVHCGGVEHTPVKPGPNDIGFCRYCMKRICQTCSDLPCRPFEKWLEQQEKGIRSAIERHRTLDTYGV